MHRKIKMYLLMAAFVFLAGCSKENRNVTETNNRIQKPQESLESQQAGEENQEEQETQEDQEEQRKIEKVTALETNVSMDGMNLIILKQRMRTTKKKKMMKRKSY